MQGEAGGTAAPGTLPVPPSPCLWVGLGGSCFCFSVPAQVLRRKQLPPSSSHPHPSPDSTPSPKLPVLPDPVWPWASQSRDETESGFL